MIALGKIINSALSNNSAVAALVADRIYPDVIPQEIERPSISYEVGSLPGIDGSAPVYGTTVVVSCFAREKTVVHGVAAVVDAVLSDLRGAADGVELRSMSRSSYQDGYDPDLDAYAVVLTYSAMLVLTADANTTWANVPENLIDHNALANLAVGDPHPQYLMESDMAAIEETLGGISDAPASSSQSGGILATLRGIWVEMVGFNERLAMLVRAIMRPIWFDPSSGALRFQAVSGTITTVSTVSTVSNQTLIGGQDAKTAFVDEIMMNTWANTIRRGIS